MAEGFYYVPLPATAKTSLVEGKDALIVTAETSAESILAARAYLHLPSDAAWTASTPVLLAHVTDLAGWRCKVTITDTDGVTITESVTVTAVTVGDFDSIGALLVIALNATSSIAAASYSTPTLTIAGSDALVDQTLTAEFLPPATWSDPLINFPEAIGSISHENTSGDALTLALIDVIAPTVLYQLGTGH